MDSDNQNMTRSGLLQSLALTPLAIAGVLAASSQADAIAMGSVPQTAVQYQTSPKGGAQCSTCRFYINNKKSKSAPGHCTQVAGVISPKGWCSVYSKGDNSKQSM
jgi:hypothetical protein